jgi:hypothetical protein
MRYWFTYNILNNKVAFYSEGHNTHSNPNWDVIELDVTPDQAEKMKQNYDMRIEGGNLVLEKNQTILSDDAAEQKRLNIQNMRGLLAKPVITPEEQKSILKTIINLIE